MQPFDKVDQYVDLLCRQIRWKKAHARISEELTDHIADARDTYIAQGLEEEEATEKAISDTGDASELGSQLDRVHRPRAQGVLLFAVVGFLLAGILLRLFIWDDAGRAGMLPFTVLPVAIGIVGLFAAYFMDFTLIGKYPKATYFTVLAITVVPLLLSPMIVPGVRMFLMVGRSAFYLSFTILLFPLALAGVIFRMKNRGYFGIIVCGLALALSGFVAILTPSVSSLLHLMGIGFALIFVAIYMNWFGVSRYKSFLLVITPAVLPAIIFFVSMGAFRSSRFMAAFNPYSDPLGFGFIAVTTRRVLRSAEFFAPEATVAEYGMSASALPHSILYSDLFLTALISRLGWIAFAVISVALMIFIIRSFALCMRQRSDLGFFVALAVLMTLSAQVLSYIVFNLGFQLVTPVSLPLISFGNTAMIVNLVLIGFMLSVFRTGDVVMDKAILPSQERGKRFVWDDGKLSIDFKP